MSDVGTFSAFDLFVMALIAGALWRRGRRIAPDTSGPERPACGPGIESLQRVLISI